MRRHLELRIKNAESNIADPELMSIGEVGVFIQGKHVGKYLLRTYSNYTLLNNPNQTWSDDNPPVDKVDILESGTQLEITIGQRTEL